MKKKSYVAVLMSTVVMSAALCGCGAGEYSSTGDQKNAAGYAGSTAWVTAEEAVADGMGDWNLNASAEDFHGEVWNTEEYDSIRETGLQSVHNQPLSTFSVDVDTASYSNLRRMIEDGYSLQEIPSGAVRTEELLNYFTYDYNLPEGDEPFGVTTVLGDCPWNENAKLLQIGLKTEEIDFSEAPDSNLVFLLDVSGSMYSDDKLPLLQKSFAMLAEELTEKDRVSIVTYAGSDKVVLEGVSGDEKTKIIDALESLEAGGSTNGADGIETAYKLAGEYFIEGEIIV